MTKGEVYTTLRGPHEGQRVRVRKASPGKVFFEYAQRLGGKRALIVMARSSFEAHHRRIG